MPVPPSSTNVFDRIRAEYPALRFGIYVYEPGAGVTLEVLTPDDQSFRFEGPDLASVLDAAFPPHAPPAPEPLPPAPPISFE